MSATINGTTEVQFNRETITFTPNVGGEYGGRYEGPKENIKVKLDELIALGYSCQYECDASPIARLTFSTTANSGSPGDQPPDPNSDYTDNFQVSRNTVQKELLMSDHPLVSSLNSENFLELKQYMEQPGTYEENDGFTLTSAASFDAAVYLFDLFRSGVRSVEVKQPILRVTRVTNPLYDRPFNTSLMDKILSTGRMIRDSRVPANFAVPLSNLASRFSRSAVVAVEGQPYSYALRVDTLRLVYGWLKDSVTAETLGTTKNQYVLEYKFGLWDTETYGQLNT